MQFPKRACLAIVLQVAASPPLSAQIVTGRLRDATANQPVAAAFVQLLDTAGVRVAGALTDSAGRFTLRASPGAYRLRAEQLGFESVTTPILRLTAGRLEHDFTLRPQALVLPAVTAHADERRCERRPDGPAVYALWNAIHGALAVTSWTREARAMRFSLISYVREVDPSLRSVRREERRPSTASAALPFRAVSSEYLAREGYLLRDGNEIVLLGLDADVLISDPFLDSHCFRLVSGRDTTLAGLGFEPLRRDGRVDVKGVLWVERSSAMLRRLEYEFVNLPAHLGRFGASGEVHFQRLDNGIWIIDRWWIRTPLVAQRGHNFELLGHREDGGTVTSAERADTELFRLRGSGVIEGVVLDSVRNAPLAEALVALSGTPFTARTGSDGRYRLERLPAGRYEIGFRHPLLEELGVATPLDSVTVTASRPRRLALATPSITTILRAACPGEEEERTTGLVHGVVRSGDRPLEGVEVRASWEGPPPSGSGPAVDRWRTATTGADGRYVICWVPTDRELTLQAGARELARRTRTVHPAGAPFVRQDFD